MNPEDFETFHQAWLNAHAMSSSNQIPSDQVVMAVFDVLAEHPLKHVLGALQVHARKARFAPTPADIIEIIESRTKRKHIGADEAWAICLASFDEFQTVVWTDEIAQARASVMGIYLDGDKTGARMAFRETYTRILETAPTPVWKVCQGFDQAARVLAVEKAIALGRLPSSELAKHQIAPIQTTVAGLIGKSQDRANKSSPENIRILKLILADTSKPVAAREVQRKQFEHHKTAQLAQVEKRLGGMH